MQRSAGILLPISSLPSPYGIGCFSQEAYDFVVAMRRYVYMVTRPGLAASTAAAQLICYNQNRAIPERGRQPRADGGADEI